MVTFFFINTLPFICSFGILFYYIFIKREQCFYFYSEYRNIGVFIQDVNLVTVSYFYILIFIIYIIFIPYIIVAILINNLTFFFSLNYYFIIRSLISFCCMHYLTFIINHFDFRKIYIIFINKFFSY